LYSVAQKLHIDYFGMQTSVTETELSRTDQETLATKVSHWCPTPRLKDGELRPFTLPGVCGFDSMRTFSEGVDATCQEVPSRRSNARTAGCEPHDPGTKRPGVYMYTETAEIQPFVCKPSIRGTRFT